jgi:hypothetical protein
MKNIYGSLHNKYKNKFFFIGTKCLSYALYIIYVLYILKKKHVFMHTILHS